jgi:uncharacterized protein (DUF1697 family)
MTSNRQVALLRGINVGRAKRVAMAELRKLVEGLGYRDVRTLLNSGNVVFSAPSSVKGDPAAQIEKALETKLGVSSRVIVLNAAELATIVDENPLLEIADNPSRLLVSVLGDPRDQAKLKPLLVQKWAPDALAIGKRVAYLWCSRGILESPLAEAVGRSLRGAATARNWATISKLHALCREGD